MDLTKYLSLKNSLTTLLIGVSISSTTNAQYTKHINTNRPSLSMGAYAVGKNTIQLEGGFTHSEGYEDKETTTYNSNLYDLDVRYGLFFEELELIAQLQLANTNLDNIKKINGLNTAEVGAKFMIYDSYKNYQEKINIYSWKANQRYKFRRLVPTVALYAGYQFNITDNLPYFAPNGGAKFAVITQQHLSKDWSFITNWFSENVENDLYRNYGYIATLSYAINSKVSIFGENQGTWYNSKTNEIPFKETSWARLGATYTITKNMQADLHAAHSISHAQDKWQFGFGFSWRNNRPTIWKNEFENINP